MTRWTIRILLCLFLGVVTTVAVAWALAALGESETWTVYTPSGPSTQVLPVQGEQGWPFKVLSLSARDAANERTTFFMLAGTQMGYVPILPGFIINTLFYAAIWFVLFFGFEFGKLALRRKRGRCVKCGYDLQGDADAGCPECGWNRTEADAS